MYPFILLTPFRNRKSPLSGKVYQLFLMSVSMFFSPSLALGCLHSWTITKKTQQNSADLVQTFTRLVDLSVEYTLGPSVRCHSSLLSPCVSEYPRHRDYSCCSCQQRASFRLSLLHSMTSAEPSHLKSRRERPLPHTLSEKNTNNTPPVSQNPCQHVSQTL